MKVGTHVSVWRNIVDGNGKVKDTRCIHRGIATEDNGTFVKVFSGAPIDFDAPADKRGDVSAQTAQVYPVDGKHMWCSVTA